MAALALVGIAEAGADLVAKQHMGLVALEARGGMRRVHTEAGGNRKRRDQPGHGVGQRTAYETAGGGERSGGWKPGFPFTLR